MTFYSEPGMTEANSPSTMPPKPKSMPPSFSYPLFFFLSTESTTPPSPSSHIALLAIPVNVDPFTEQQALISPAEAAEQDVVTTILKSSVLLNILFDSQSPTL